MTATQVANANIHHYFPHPETGAIAYDEDGDPWLGFYYELIAADGKPLSAKVGPYGSAAEAEAACKLAWEKGDY